MKTKFEAVPQRARLIAWSKSVAAAQNLRAAIERANPGTSTDNPVVLPSNVAQASAAERCEWALKQLSAERHAVAAARDQQVRGADVRERLEKLRAEKQAQESARARKRFLKLAAAAAVLIFIVGGAGMVWLQRRPPSISRSDVEERIVKAVAERGFAASSIVYEVGTVRDGVAPVQAMFTAKLDRPLFVAVPLEPYLQGELKLDPKVSRRITELTSGKGANRVLELAGLADETFDATKLALLKVVSQPGTSLSGSASLRATRQAGGWVLSEAITALPPLQPNGKPRQAFVGRVFELDREEDRTRLRALVNDQPNILAKLERARETYTVEVMALHRKEEESLVNVFRSGAIFTGTMAGRTPNEKKAIHFELTDAAGGFGTHAVKALFHNDGGWGDGRAFEGAWKFDTVDDRFELSLASGSDQFIRAGGPVLGDAKLVKLELAIDAERLSGQLDTTACQFARVADADVDRAKREASPDYFGMRDAIVPDTIYSGAVKVTETSTQQILLRFMKVENAGAVVEALLQDPENESFQFRLTGALIGNRYREPQWPLRLAVIRAALSPGIPAKTFIMQFPALALRIENGRLIGDYRGRPFHFERLSREETTRKVQATSAWRRTFDAAIRPGNVLEGTTADPQMNVRTPVRLRITNVNPADNSITARLDSGQTPGLFRNLTGKFFADAGTLNFAFDIRAGEYAVDRRAPEPFFKSGRDNLLLTLEGSKFTGQDGHTWRFEFNVDSRGVR